MAADDIWYYARGGQRIGPVTELDLSNTIARGELRPDDLVWKEGMAQWVQLRFAEGLPESPTVGEASTESSPAPMQAAAPAPATVAALPVAPVAAVPVGYATPMQPAVRYADFGQRLLAWFIDRIVIVVLQFVALIPLAMYGAFADETYGPSDARDTTLGLVMLGVWVGIGWLYHAALEASRWQATLGKRALSLRVTDITGVRASFIQTSVRHWLKIVSGLILCFGYLMAAFTQRRQALHDMAANTLILHVPQPTMSMHYPHAPMAGRL